MMLGMTYGEDLLNVKADQAVCHFGSDQTKSWTTERMFTQKRDKGKNHYCLWRWEKVGGMITYGSGLNKLALQLVQDA